jgi:hypothetical protein
MDSSGARAYFGKKKGKKGGWFLSLNMELVVLAPLLPLHLHYLPCPVPHY